MKETINFRFNNFKQDSIGAIPTLSKAIRGMKYSKQEINNAFKKFVPKDEFATDERDSILEDLYSKTGEELSEKNLIKSTLQKE